MIFLVLGMVQLTGDISGAEAGAAYLPRTAVRLDRRHYNAWYGIGLTYYKQERFSLADG